MIITVKSSWTIGSLNFDEFGSRFRNHNKIFIIKRIWKEIEEEEKRDEHQPTLVVLWSSKGKGRKGGAAIYVYIKWACD